MHKVLKKFVLLSSILFVLAQLLFQNCAQIASPPGGKKDTLAPTIIQSIPLNKSKNFKGKKIELSFNEYISIRNINQELLITPNVGFYETKIKPNGVSIILDSALKENTTYTFNFRNAIEDVSERNIGKNIKLVFSTSNMIDSLVIKGNVKTLHNNKKIENILVGLYPYTDTLRIDKVKPYYFTKTDTSGNYSLENLASGKYYLAAFEDINNNLLLNSNKEQVDFITDKFITLTSNREQDFKIALQNLDPIKQLKVTSTAKTILYEYNRGIKNITLSNAKGNVIPVYQLENNKNIRFYVDDIDKKDTLFLRAMLEDSLGRETKFDLKLKFREINKKEKVLPNSMRFDIKPALGTLLSPNDSLLIHFEKPIKTYDLTKITWQTGPNEQLSIPAEYYHWNKFKNELSLPTFFFPKKNEFELKIEKAAFVSIESDTNLVYQQKIERQDLENYGILEGRINQAKNGSKYIVELLNSFNNEMYQKLTVDESFSFKHVEPGTYIIRAIEDKNKNGVWDIGNFLKYEKPENIYFMEGKIKMKANFQITDLLINTQN
ncbi:Ig-like domain-containing protein [Aquirufa sp. ROCK-SH2]